MSISKVIFHFSCENVEKKSCALELNIVIHCLRFFLIEIVLGNFMMGVISSKGRGV